MKLICFGSSSAGNCYLLDNGREALLIECGIQFSEVVKHLGTGIGRIKGCLITHEHGDHAKYAKNVCDARIPLYMSYGTLESLRATTGNLRDANVLSTTINTTIGGFRVLAFDTCHDAAEPFGFVVTHKDLGSLVFATDTYMLKHRFSSLNHLMIECNYDIELLDANTSITPQRRNRTIKSHMELSTCIDAVKANNSGKLRNVILLHMSDSNSDEKRFADTVQGLTRAKVSVARKGFTIELNKEPF